MHLQIRENQLTVEPGSGAGLLAIPKNSSLVIRTPDPHLAQVWLGDTQDNYLVALSEKSIYQALASLGRQDEDIYDRGLIATKITLAQAPLLSTISKNVHGLAGQVQLELSPEKTAIEALKKQRPLISPIAGSRDDFLQYLLKKYSLRMQGRSVATVLFSGGWDSRLELALVRASLPNDTKLVLAHVQTNDAELEVVKRIASLIGAELVIGDAEALIQFGLGWPNLIRELRKESTWRSTVPVYGAFAALLNANFQKNITFGFCPFPLKGRDYDINIRDSAPEKGRVRVIKPDPNLESYGFPGTDEAINLQRDVWQSLISGTETWTDTQVRDWMNWNGYYANGYAHRIRSLQNIELDPIYAHSDVVARFMGLADSDKRGTSFIEYALKSLIPEIESVAVLASTGDLSRGTDKYGGGFVDSSVCGRLRAVFSEMSTGVTENLGLSSLKDPMQFRSAVWAALFSVEERRSSMIVDDLLKLEHSCKGVTGTNATQLADFISDVSPDPHLY